MLNFGVKKMNTYSNKFTMRENNEAVVLQTIIEQKEMSRAKLAQVTGLTKASLSSISKTLLDHQLIKEVGIGEASSVGGRKPVFLELNAQAGICLAIDISYNHVSGLASYLNGQKLDFITLEDISVNQTNAVDFIKQIVADLEKNVPSTPHGIVGLTIGIHGIVKHGQIIFTPYYDIDTIDFQKELAQLYTYPIYLENEANLSAMAEYTFSSKNNNIISMSIHSGIGAGIISHGHLQKGSNGRLGEIGHAILIPEGRPCPCGNKGCTEQYLSNKVLYKEIAELKHLDKVNSDTIVELLQDKDSEVTDKITGYAKMLSVPINNLITHFDPEAVILNSAVIQKIPDLLEIIQEHLSSRFTNRVSIEVSQLGNKAILLGGIVKCGQEFLGIETFKMPG